MAEALYKTKSIQSLLSKRRRKRAEFILSKVNVYEGMSILDIGCGPNGRSFEDHISPNYKITGIDILDGEKVKTDYPNFKNLKQDAEVLSIFSDREFDLVVSIGMMEHICDEDALHNMSSEIARVSKQSVIVVPWKYEFIEPHFKFPFFQLLPYFLKVFLTKALNLHNLGKSVEFDSDYIRKNYQWFSNKRWSDVFKGLKCFVTTHLDTIAIVKTDNYKNIV